MAFRAVSRARQSRSLSPASLAGSAVAFFVCTLLVALAYWPGLRGPLLLDDFANLGPVGEWLAGDRTWDTVVFGNRSGPLGRPLAMASFLADAALWGNSLWHAKLTSLLVHLACGGILFLLCRRLLARDPQLARHRWLPLLLAAAWMALPIQVSSVLYLVQRMAMLSALWMALAMYCYVLAREAQERGQRRGTILLWAGVPLLTLLAAFSKENGLLVPLLVLAIEAAWFGKPGQSKPVSVKTFFLLAVAVPAAVAVGYLAFHPGFLPGRYATRDFTLLERLLTEPRILWDYVASILVPFGPKLGIFHDHYPKSTGLLSPPATLAAILAWVAIVAFAWCLRRRHPTLAGGVFLYLAGHAMESTAWPLELYFEHRNYLPAIGVLLACAGIGGWAAERLGRPTQAFRAAGAALLVLVPLAYLGVTHGRARVWSSAETLYAQELRFNGDSPRLRSNLAAQAMNRGDLTAALAHIEVADRNSPPREDMTIALWRMLAYCAANTAPGEPLYTALEAQARGRIHRNTMVAWEELTQRLENGRCPALDASRIAQLGEFWLQRTTSPPRSHEAWRTRYNLARLYAAQSRFEVAARLGEQAWRDSDYNNGVGVFVFQVNASLERWDVCEAVYLRLERSRGGNLKLNRALDAFRAALVEHGRLAR